MRRLKKRRAFVAAAKSPQAARAVRPGLVLQARPRGDADPGAVGFTASRRAVGGAVARNRARRRLRAAAAAILAPAARPGTDYVLIARPASLTRPFRDLCRDLHSALRAAHDPRRRPNPPRARRPGPSRPA